MDDQSRLQADAEVICGACTDRRHEDCRGGDCDCTHDNEDE